MFTVVIAEKEHLDNIQEYQLYLNPFIKKDQFVFCQWNPEEKGSLADAVPELESVVAHREVWRAVILCPEEYTQRKGGHTECNINFKNPFNVTRFKECTKNEEESELAFFERRQKMQFNTYEEASKRPLVRLVTRLCEDPSVTRETYRNAIRDKINLLYQQELNRGVDDGEEKNADIPAETEDTSPIVYDEEFVTKDEWDYLFYYEGFEKKIKIRNEIRGNEKIPFSLPAEVLCITIRKPERELNATLKSSWIDHDELQYTNFQDSNLYFDKMRYLVFDLDDKEKLRYTLDYIRFIYGVLLLAGNEIPMNTLTPARVFQLNCEIDEDFMKSYLGLYFEKLNLTKEEIKYKLKEIERTQLERLSNAEAQSIFCANISVNVSKPEMENRDTFLYREKIGLAGDCPVSEENRWFDRYKAIGKSFHRYLKLPRRAVVTAAEDVHRMNVQEDERVNRLNEFQLEDIRDHVNEEKVGMVSTITTSLYEEDSYVKRMDEEDEKIQEVMRERVTRKKAICIGGIALGTAFLSSIPFLLDNRSLPLYIIYVLALSGVALVLLAGIGLLTLTVLRHKLKKAIRSFNEVMRSILNEVDDSLRQYAIYLSHVLNIMRGYSVFDLNKDKCNYKQNRVSILKKHMGDIEERKATVRQIFGMFLDEKIVVRDKVDAYDYDFSRAVDYDYPLPTISGEEKKIFFLQPDNFVEIPIGFVKKVTIRREEIYD